MASSSSDPKGMFNIQALREMVASGRGKEIWRSFDDLVDSDSFLEFVREEFPRQASLASALSRRDFLKVLGASLAFAGLSGCAPRTGEQIFPYVQAPEELVPGKPLFFASAMTLDGYAQGVLVRSDMGRPTKIEGNPKHPASLGTSDIFMQATILDLYDPDRAKIVRNQGNASSWVDFITAIAPLVVSQGSTQGAGLRVLTENITSPTLADQLRALSAQFPKARWHTYSPVGRTEEHAGAVQAFGEAVDPVYHFDKAAVILSLDADFMFREPGSLRYKHDFGLHRQVVPVDAGMSRLYVVESSLTLTGSNADNRVALPARQVETFARAVAGRLGIDAGTVDTTGLPSAEWLDALVSDLRRQPGASLVVAGDRQPAAVHALAYAMNQALGSIGQTIDFIDPVEPGVSSPAATLADLVADLDTGTVELLVILEGNPAYKAPVNLHFSDSLKKAKQVVYLSLYDDETAALAHWHIPATHFLEMWSDARAFDGTAGIIQPLIDPLYQSKSSHEVLAVLLGQPNAKGYDIVRGYWQSQSKAPNFDQAWQAALSDGVIADTASPPRPVPPAAAPPPPPRRPQRTHWRSCLSRTPPSGMDGLPITPGSRSFPSRSPSSPGTTPPWSAPPSPSAKGSTDQDVVALTYRGRTLEAPVLIQPGQPDHSVTLTLGYGRSRGGKVLENTGYNAYALRPSETPWFGDGLELSKTGRQYTLATTRDHSSMEGRDIVHTADYDQFRQNPEMFGPEPEHLPSLYPEVAYNGHAWGMSINLSTCIGCNACVVACQAENNIPTVGKDQVTARRARCTGCASTATSRTASTIPRCCFSRCRACTAKRRPASRSARSRRPATAPKASTR